MPPRLSCVEMQIPTTFGSIAEPVRGKMSVARRRQVDGSVPGRSTARRCPRCSLQNSNRTVLLKRVDAFAQAQRAAASPVSVVRRVGGD